MTTKKKTQANRNNAKHSTGPRTDKGKQICSQNALKHGLRSKHPVLPGEDPIEYQHKLDQLRADIRPLNALEDDLVEQIADTSWRLKRLSRIEAAIERFRIDKAQDETNNIGKDDEQILGDGLTGWANLDYLNRLGRYEAQLSRRYHRAMKELRDLRTTYEQTSFRTRSVQERDHEEQEWRKRHPQSPPEQPKHPPAAANTSRPAKSQTSGQTENGVTGPNGMTWDEVDELHPDQVIKLIEQELNSMTPTTGQPGPQEAQN